ncbi:MAG: CHAT domain-containing protein, partial [Gemmataceae bacterium]|nr:CHAT domain-containing protein [Gemmataceae bacterium]
KEKLEERLGRLSEEFRARRQPVTSARLRSLLPPGVVLVDILDHAGYDPARPVPGQEPKRRLTAWILRSDASTVRVPLGDAGRIEKETEEWRVELEKGSASAPQGAALRRLVWEPLEKHLGGAKLVLVSPDGAATRLPFAALPGSKPGKVLLEEVPLAMLPVSQALPELLEAAKGGTKLLTAGGIDFDAKPAGQRLGPVAKWQPLPATVPEAEAIGKLHAGGTTALGGKAATKAAVREGLATHRYAHLATHGFFAPPTMTSGLLHVIARPERLFGLTGASGFHPGLLSGIVLAGANNPTDRDDGVLTALEIADMDLSGMELAVLSACQTGLGQEAAGEGMRGLQRAFAVAGCKSVVSSLWSVHDAATAVLMERFYHHLWKGKKSKLEALRLAQLEVRDHPDWVEKRQEKMSAYRGPRGAGMKAVKLPGGARRSPPAWWAAWQLSGDWR